jgi:hypothetical protein
MKSAAKKNSASKKPAQKSPAKKSPAKKSPAKKSPAKKSPEKESPEKGAAGEADATSKLIEERIRAIGGWRGATMARMRALILAAAPELREERKWIKPTNPFGVPTYSHAGLVLTLEVYKSTVKLTFARGAAVPDPTRIFNASLLGTRRAIDLHEGETVDAEAFCALVQAAVAMNAAKKGG